MAEGSNSSSYNITEAVLTSYDGRVSEDISSIIVSVQFSQSINNVGWSGVINVQDNVGLMDNLARGEEDLKLKIESLDTNITITLNTKVINVGNVKPIASGNGLSYDLTVVSKVTFNANKRKVVKAFKSDSIAGMADKIFNEYYNQLGTPDFLDPEDRTRVLSYAAKRLPFAGDPERSFILQPTVGIFDIVIPNYIPPEAMAFLTRRGFNPETKSHTYRFFETFENYYFVTDEFLIQEGVAKSDKIKSFFYSPSSTLDTRNPASQVQRIEEIVINNRGTNTAADLYSGGYTNTVHQVDIINGTYDEYHFNYLDDAKYIDMSGNRVNMENNPHTEAYTRDTFTQENSRKFMVYKDFLDPTLGRPSSLRTEVNLPEVISSRVSYNHHLNNTTISAGLKGRLDLRPGEIIDFDTKDFNALGSVNKSATLSGRYLINSVNHNLSDGIIKTSLSLSKFNWS